MDRRVRSVLETLDSQWERRVSVSELARMVGLGASRLQHLFRTHAKMTIRDFVREQRLAKAAELLRASDERISAISMRVGFRDVSNFNHAFKKRYGVAPRVYRQRCEHDEVSRFDQEIAEDTN